MNNLEFQLRVLIRETLDQDYKGEHEAPHASDGEVSSPLYDMVGSFGEDIYTSNAVRYFGTGQPYDQQAASIIQSVRNKPNALVTIYRAVPDVNFEIKKKIKPLADLLNYELHFGFLPIRHKRSKEQNQIIDFLEEKYKTIDNYDQQKEAILNDIKKQIEDLSNQKKKLPQINDGDWVTTIRQYAVEHGQGNLNKKYKVIQKTVRAKNIYGNGDSLVEFGYSA